MGTDRLLAPGIIEKYTLVKRDVNGDIFEIIEGGDDKESKVIFRRLGELASSYANLPCEVEGNIYVT